MSVFSANVQGMENVRIAAKCGYARKPASFSYGEDVIQAVRNCKLLFKLHNFRSYDKHNRNNPVLVNGEDVASRMEKYNEENLHREDYYSVGSTCFPVRDGEEDEFNCSLCGYSKASAPVIFECCEVPSDPLVPSLVLCAFGWGVERVNVPCVSMYIQDMDGFSTFVTVDRWNYKLNFESNEEFMYVQNERQLHEEKYADPSVPYEFGYGDFLHCCVQPVEGSTYSKTETVCALTLQKFVKDANVPFIAYFRRTIRKSRTIVWAKAYNCEGYSIQSIDNERNCVMMADKTGYVFPVKWGTWHRALSYPSFKDYKDATSRIKLDEDSEAQASQFSMIARDLEANEDSDVFFLPGVTPLKSK